MTRLIHTKGRYRLLLVLLLNSFMVYSQSTKIASFKDYPIVSNLDSFERVVRGLKNNPEQYLHGLITLEVNRTSYDGWFGQDFDTIKILAYQLHSPLAIATYEYLRGIFEHQERLEVSSRHTLSALRYFETAKDTLGMMNCYYGLMRLNGYSVRHKNSKVLTSDIYFDKILELSQQSTDIRIKAVRIKMVCFFEQSVTGKQNVEERIKEIKEILLLLDKNVNYQPAFVSVYVAISTFYALHEFSEEAFEYSIKSDELSKKLSSKICISNNYGLALVYAEGKYKNHKKAEELLLATLPYIENDKNNNIRYVYTLLGDIKYENKDYDAAWYYKEKEVEGLIKYTDKLKNSVVEELRTQYEIDEKETENGLYRIIIGISLGAFVLVGLLGYLLYRSNRKLKELIVFRDQLFGIIAHDMRTPFIAFQRFSDGVSFLLEKKEYHNIHVLSQSINQLVSNTGLLLDNLLSWYALQNTPKLTKQNTVSLYELAQEGKALYEVIAKDHQSTIEIAIPESLRFDLDKNVFLLILRNLIDNAIKHGKSNKIMLKAHVEASYIVIEVINNGTVFSASKLAAIQQQIQQNSGNANGGRGLGLYLVCHFLQQYKGSLSVESSAEEGVKFTVKIPAVG